MPNPFEAIRYHSLAIYRDDLPDDLEITAWTDNGLIMGVRHREYPIEGIQFHPESIMTKVGKDLLKNFLDAPVWRDGRIAMIQDAIQAVVEGQDLTCGPGRRRNGRNNERRGDARPVRRVGDRAQDEGRDG